MSFLAWTAVVGVVLLTMALSSAYVQRLPISTSIIYLALGVIMGPVGFAVLHLDVRSAVHWFGPVTEVSVIIALFIGGLKMRLPPRDPAWRAPLLLAGPVMVLCIAGTAAFAHLVLRLDLATALLLGAVLAPTDPVLAGAVSVASAADKSRLRYALSGEAGLNDGTAFPFVVLALSWREHGGPGSWLAGWAVHRLAWAIIAGLAFGFLLGHVLGRIAIRLRSHHRDTNAPSDFLALSLIALSYVGAESIGAWGFLAVFAAGVGLRHAEMKVVRATPHPDRVRESQRPHDRSTHPPAEELVAATVTHDSLKEPAVAAGSLVAETLSFGATSERMLEVLLVVLVGAGLATHWDARGVVLALALMLVVRPLATWMILARSPLRLREVGLVSWFGIRGIGSLYYLGYALTHGVSGPTADEACAFTLTVISTSIVLHGISASPLLGRYERQMVAP